ncbi:cytochrome C551 [Paenibacillus sp. BIHB 4019]|uniref:Cytochrome C551 n=1 Tax=Paenibacillus sp. BIHB 4019 TaxID=1870819 RepID=A0A1B2DCH4_9BACL|nr:cytochrome c [Paenibacillus sp. BIHB 4019]ANY65413.1 cytochrome C551 [Paenibacillus sp. BIHB 4019]
MLRISLSVWGNMLLLAVLTTVLLAACGGTSQPGTKATPHMDAPDGTASVYKSNCISCHGTDLQGRMGTETNLQKVGARMSEADIVKQLQNGKGSMPPFKDRLTSEEIAGLAAWLAGKK